MKQITAQLYFAIVAFQIRNKLNTKLIIFLFLFVFYSSATFSQVGILTDTPHVSSALDIESTDKGILIPRISLTNDLTSPSPVSSPALGLLIFNSGVNQSLGFYYWDGSKWVSTSFSTTNWNIYGNSSTSIQNNFLGTADNQDFAIRTNNNERVRIESDGQVMIGSTIPFYDSDLFTVQGNATQYSAINAYSPNGYGVFSQAGSIGFLGKVNYEQGFGLWAENQNVDGYGAIIMGSNSGAYTLNSHSTALSAHGSDGIFCVGHSTNGIGIIAGGNNSSSLSIITEGTGGAFTGYHGVYGKATNSSSGVGVIGVGNNQSTYHTTSNGSGGAFTGYHGSFSYSTTSSNGTGVIGIGNDGSYYLMANGSGGAFTGSLIGAAGWSTNSGGYGIYGKAMGGGYGVFSSGNFGASGTKSFVIDHPLDPENKILKHYSVESPEVLNMYRGNVILNDGGEAVIILPNYFWSININFSYILTAIGKAAPNIYIKNEINEDGEFTISGGETGQKISWVVYAERNDPYMKLTPNARDVVIDKTNLQKNKYISPELYNQPENKSIFYQVDVDAKSKKGFKAKTIEVINIDMPKKINNQ